MDTLIHFGLFVALVLALFKAVDNPKTAIAAAFYFYFSLSVWDNYAIAIIKFYCFCCCHIFCGSTIRVTT